MMQLKNFLYEDRSNLNFGEILKEERKRHNLSVRELSDITDVSTTYLSKLENQKRSFPSKETIFNIAGGLDLFIEENYLSELNDFKTTDAYSYKLLTDFINAKDS
ncbi:helix-turn-helix domain-containing protein, partial [Staphylococcus nepalensis]|uniref:helix-turn-helix domain-containing protein n=1 Tax=Staphylococcus nepalensis TaxID=214473 RepID=UPI002175181D